jgi:hypothetical protein
LKIFFELKWIFPELDIDDCIIDINNKRYDVDIFSKILNTVIEYDGSYHHSKSRAIIFDAVKTKYLINNNYNVIRIRSNKLGKITDNDILIDSYDPKIIVNSLLTKIIKTSLLHKNYLIGIRKIL